MASNPGLLPDLSKLRLAPNSASGLLLLENPGDADSYPVWEVRGPGNTFKAISPTGERLVWLGSLTENEELTIDTQLGTVVDQSGENRYEELDDAPRMWTIPPGDWEAEVSLEGTSTGRWVANGTPTTNQIRNPRVSAAGSTSIAPFFGAASGPLSIGDGGILRLHGSGSGVHRLYMLTADSTSQAARTWGPLVPGQRVAMRAKVRNPMAFPLRIDATVQAVNAVYNASGVLQSYATTSSDYQKSVEIPAGGEAVVQFSHFQPSPLGSDTNNAAWFFFSAYKVDPTYGYLPLPGGEFIEFSEFALFFGSDAPTTQTVPFFSGDTSGGADGIYAWTGTPNASTSTRTPTKLVGASRIAVSWRPRRHFVI